MPGDKNRPSNKIFEDKSFKLKITKDDTGIYYLTSELCNEVNHQGNLLDIVNFLSEQHVNPDNNFSLSVECWSDILAWLEKESREESNKKNCCEIGDSNFYENLRAAKELFSNLVTIYNEKNRQDLIPKSFKFIRLSIRVQGEKNSDEPRALEAETFLQYCEDDTLIRIKAGSKIGNTNFFIPDVINYFVMNRQYFCDQHGLDALAKNIELLASLFAQRDNLRLNVDQLLTLFIEAIPENFPRLDFKKPVSLRQAIRSDARSVCVVFFAWVAEKYDAAIRNKKLHAMAVEVSALANDFLKAFQLEPPALQQLYERLNQNLGIQNMKGTIAERPSCRA
jgi:hypothetical protein